MNLDKYVGKIVTFQQRPGWDYVRHALILKNDDQYFAGFKRSENPDVGYGRYYEGFKKYGYDAGWALSNKYTEFCDFVKDSIRIDDSTYGEIK